IAAAQFSTPYDPDFAPEVPAAPVEQPVLPQTPTGRLPEWVKDAGPFLLIERSDPNHLFEAEGSTVSSPGFEAFVENFRPLSTDQARWNKMRVDADEGRAPSTDFDLPTAAPTPFQLAEGGPGGGPKPTPPELEIPSYGTSLSITGRKVIGFSFAEKRFLHTQVTSGRAKESNLIDITQQLQLRMQGKVGPKITVNVDYDDTKLNKQDISIVYQGDPNEVVQNASFGDIDLSLPATEFVSYNKQLFGIRVNLKYKGFNALFIGSRTKGQTKTMQFRGNTEFTGMDIADTAFVRRRFYDLSYGNPTRLPLAPGSEKVFISRQAGAVPNVNDISLTVDDLAVNTSSFTGTFTRLNPGVDYTVDYVKGILSFRGSIDPQSVVAVDFVDATGRALSVQTSTTTGTSGGTGLNKLIKTFADVPIVSSTTEVGWRQELKTFYNIGRTQIVRDDGRGNFFLQVLNQARQEVGSSLNPIQKYPDTIEVDFENGLFRLKQPFGVSVSSPQPDLDIYSDAPISKHLFHVEFRFRLRTFFLEPNLVVQSEIVLVDNVKLQRNVDYFIDYESGFITFFNDQRIRPDSTIDVSYEVSPFGGAGTESLLGTRLGYDLNKHFSIGTTLLYQTGAKPPTVPTVSDLAKSLLVYEADSQVKDVQLTSWLKGTFQGEIAQSISDPNLSGKAIVENMEGIKQDDAAPTIATAWQIASNPTQASADPQSLNWVTESVRTLDVNPTAPANSHDVQNALDINYDFTVNGSTEVSLVHVYSPTGLDFTQKSVLEFTIFQSSPTDNELNIHLGGISEDAEGSGILETEDVNRDGVLQPSEDIGFQYCPVGKNCTRFGAGNGRIDTEDLNQNGRLDPADFSGDDFGYAGNNPQLFDVTSNSTRTTMNFSGWHTFQVPLNISSATVTSWLAIKQVRISIRRGASGTDSGTLKFARLGVVGNAWQRGQPGDPATGATGTASEALTVNAVNNLDNPGYIPIFRAGGDAQRVYTDLYGSVANVERQNNTNNVSEQALDLHYTDLTPGTTVFTKRVFSRAIDVSNHRNFSFLVFGNAQSGTPANGDKILFVRAGGDVDYFEMRIPINFTGWQLFTARQQDTNGDQIADTWTLGKGVPGTVVLSSGVPNLQQIGALTVGVYSTGTFTTNGDVYVDEFHLSEPITRRGTAEKLQADFVAPGWGTFGFRHRSIDRNYQTPTTVVSNQDNRQDNAYLNFDHIKPLPLRFALSRTIVVTPNTNATGPNSNLVNLLQGGKVTTWNGNASGNLSLPNLPRVSMGYDRNRVDYQNLTRLDDRASYTGSVSYGVPSTNKWLPRTIDVNGAYAKYLVSFDSPLARSLPGNYNTDERTVTHGARLSFTPWTGSTFNPSYSVTSVREDRADFTSGAEIKSSYPKSRNQTMGFASNFRMARWLNPTVSYNINTIENTLLVPSTFVVTTSTYVFAVGDLKTVNRSANGNISLTLAAAELIPKTKLLRSLTLTNGYQLQDGEVLNNVERNLDTRFNLFVRTPLRAASPVAQLANRTLRDTYSSTVRWSPLEGYNLIGRKAALKTFNVTNNFLQSTQRTLTTGTPSKTIATTLPDMLASIGQLEQLLFADRFMKNVQLNVKYAQRSTLNVGFTRATDSSFGSDLRAMIRQRFDTSLSFNMRSNSNKDLVLDQTVQTTGHKDATLQTTFDIRRFRFTPKVDYQNDTSTLGTGVKTQDTTVVTPALLVRSDISLPRGIYLPFTKKTLLVTNRVIWTSNLSLTIRSSPVTVADNSKLASFTTSADYEIAKNLRMTINGAFQRLWHKYLQEEDFISYQFGTTLTFQF
ncbi:MAG TPA: hypothetical protein VNI01_13785, partial [Elusimicrobiota bacterium]|nr:hypothetical protein [Elusimicrobiota bacterium]